MTRQRQQESLWSNLYTDCPYCRGRGIVKSATTMSVELQRRLSSVARRLQLRQDGKEYSLRVLVHPGILERLRSEDADLLVRMETSYGVKLAFRADPAYHVEHFKSSTPRPARNIASGRGRPLAAGRRRARLGAALFSVVLLGAAAATAARGPEPAAITWKAAG